MDLVSPDPIDFTVEKNRFFEYLDWNIVDCYSAYSYLQTCSVKESLPVLVVVLFEDRYQ